MTPTQRSYQQKRMGSFPALGVLINITIALSVTGIIGLLGIYTFRLQQHIRENTPVRVFLRSDLPEAQRIQLEQKLASYTFVAQKNGQARVRFLSKEDAMQQEIERTGEDFSELIANPLPDSYFIHLKDSYYTQTNLKAIREKLEALVGVREIKIEEDFVAEINRNFRLLIYILGTFALVFFVASVILIDNALRLALFSQRFLIRSMQLVGASRGFIIRPFLRRAMQQGLIAAGISVVVMSGLSYLTRNWLESLSLLQDLPLLVLLAFFLIALGIFLSAVSAYWATRKYLKMSLDELY
ncbi:MAG: permease-like cell division protein FtsX [Bacteroidota bacterium]